MTRDEAIKLYKNKWDETFNILCRVPQNFPVSHTDLGYVFGEHCDTYPELINQLDTLHNYKVESYYMSGSSLAISIIAAGVAYVLYCDDVETVLEELLNLDCTIETASTVSTSKSIKCNL